MGRTNNEAIKQMTLGELEDRIDKLVYKWKVTEDIRLEKQIRHYSAIYRELCGKHYILRDYRNG